MKKRFIYNFGLTILLAGGFFVFTLGASAAVLEEQVNFYVDSGYDAQDRSQLTASLKAIGENIYFYVDNYYWNNLSGTDKNGLREKLEELADEFDKVIYPKERAVFGSEWSPGIDGDKRITVLVSELTNSAGGYVKINDEYPRSQFSNSNEREMFYINALGIFNVKAKSVLAHEFQHLISFYQKTVLYGIEEEVWLNEARSEYAPTVCGYNDNYKGSYLAERVDTFLDEPSDPLGEWKNNVSDYGAVGLFLHYLVDHYGVNAITRMTLNNEVGIASVSAALSDLGFSETFSDIFADWSVANYLNDCEIGEGDYCYLNKNLTYQRLNVDESASYSGFPNLIVSRSSSSKDWSPYWYEFKQGTAQATDRDTLKLEFVGSELRGDFRAPYIVTDQNGESTVQFISLNNQKGTAYIPNFSSLGKSVVMIPFNQYKKSGFGSNDVSVSFSFTASSVTESEVPVIEEEEIIEPIVNYPDGSLIRAKGDYKVYIINGGYKRWIQNSKIFDYYGHLNWESIIEVSREELSGYRESWLIRADGDKRVYEVNGDGTKHWLNMTAEQFSITGRLWDMVYIINTSERDLYQTGADVMYKG
ncbi:hypothetical protein KKG85_00120 [Patescibacteria group bacterium]|nr:hypothetical protein [Patescibacteria group bacterium]MBU2579445.1 hypothetical protein [Patescibacteria group bacterium]